jgi:hypothetical protein
MSFVVPFLIYAVIMYVIMYVLVEYGQKYLQDEVTPHAPIKVGIGAMIAAGMLTWTHSSFDTMFTADIGKTVLLGIVLMGIFILLYQFQPLHGAGFGLVFLLLFPGIATMAVDGLPKSSPPQSPVQSSTANKGPIRKGLNSGPAPAPAAPAEKK